MTTEATTTDPNVTSTQAAPAPQPAAPAITPEIQAMIDAARAEGRNSGAADTRRALEAKLRNQAPNAAQPQQAASQPQAPAAQSVDYQAMRSFDRAMRRFDLTDAALAVVEEDFARANPSDPTAWVTARATAYGWRQLGATATPAATTSTPAPATPATATTMPTNHAPVTSGGPPPPAPAVRDDMRILDMSIADRNALLAKHGPIEFSARLRRELATVRVGPASGRR